MKNYFIPFPELETERCLLKEITSEHANDIFAIYGDPKVMTFMQSTALENHNQANDLINKWTTLRVDNKGIRWGVFLKSNPKRLIGTIALQYWNKSSNSIEIGADLNREYWGQGLAFEFTKVAIDFAFTNLNINRLELRCNPKNKASYKIAEKFGMTFEGTLREYVLIPNKGYDDESVFSILKKEYKKASQI